MANLQKLLFYKGNYKDRTEFVKGAIYFDTASHEIRVGNGGTSYDIYGRSGTVSDANLDTSNDKVILTISKFDGTNIKLDFSDIASAADVSVTFEKLTDRLDADEAELKSLINNIVATNVSDADLRGFNLKYISDNKTLNLTYTDLNKNTTTVSTISVADFVKDGMIKGAALGTADKDGNVTVTINNGSVSTSGCTAGHKYIVLIWNTDAATDAMAIDVNDLVDIYKAGAGITITADNTISVRHDDTLKTTEGVLGVNFGMTIQKTTSNSYDSVWQEYE